MELLTTQETAVFLNVSLSTLRHWIATDQAPPSAKFGRRRMFLKSQCEAFVQARFATISAA